MFNAYYIYLTGTYFYRTITSSITDLLINNPYTIVVNWTRQYQVRVDSTVPVIISLAGLQNISGYSVTIWLIEVPYYSSSC